MGNLYNKADATVKAAANAIIIEGLKDPSYMKGLHDEAIALGGDRGAAFQQVLDNRRDSVIAKADLLNKPTGSLLKANGIDDRTDVAAQVQLLRALKETMATEGKPHPLYPDKVNMDYTNQQLADIVRNWKNSEQPLPQLNITYKPNEPALGGHGLANKMADANVSKQR